MKVLSIIVLILLLELIINLLVIYFCLAQLFPNVFPL